MTAPGHDALVAAVADLRSLLRAETMPMEGRLRRLISTPDIYRLRQIILTGSGDSLIAAAAAAAALRCWTGLPVQPMPAMEAARYLDTTPPLQHPRGVLVLCLSHSGESARVIEAARRLREWGALTVALTGNAASRLASAAELVGNIAVPACKDAQARGYATTLMGLWLFGIRIAEVRLRMTMDAANDLRATLVAQSDLLEAALPVAAHACMEAAERWHRCTRADALGSGPALGSAQFAAAKLIEAAGIHATAQDIEEFHHLNYFVGDPATVPTLVFTATRSQAASRATELAAALQQLARPTLLITDAPAAQDGAPTLCLPRTAEWAQPLLHAIPAVMLAAAWAGLAGATPFHGHAGPWRGARDAGLVRNSAILPRIETEGAPS